jgi:hypothetical protein
MIMKQVKYLIVFVIATILSTVLASCNGMDNEPTNSYTNSNFWTSIDKAQYMLNMAYNQLYSAGKMWNDERLSDNVFQGRSYTDQRTIRNGIADPSLGLFASEWSDLYGGIKTCHVFLENIDKLDATDDVKNNMKAQARFIRASLYFRLTNFYGDIPFFTKDITLAESRTVARTPRSQVIDFIHQELTDILPYLPTRDALADADRGKITQGADLMLQARAYLYDSDWQNVEKYCTMLMSGQYGSYALFSSYTGLFEAANEYNSEVIMDVSYVPTTRTWGDMFDMVPLSVGGRVCSTAPTQSLVDNYLMLDGSTIKNSTTYNEANPYLNRDPRLTATVVYNRYNWSKNVNDGTKNKYIYTDPTSTDKTDAYQGLNANQSCTGYYVRKYYDVNHEAGMASGINIITMRYADVLLMYAEAMNEQQKMTADIWNKTIRPIRVRAGFTKTTALDYPATATQAEMRQIIRNERRAELALEGLRWYDIKRWKAGTEYLNGYVYGARFGANSTYIKLDNYQFIESRDYLWSIPQSQMDINANLKPNNPGYAN